MRFGRVGTLLLAAGMALGVCTASSYGAVLDCGDSTSLSPGDVHIGNVDSAVDFNQCDITFNAGEDFGAGAEATITSENLAAFGTLTMAWIEDDGSTVIDSIVVAANPAQNLLATFFLSPDRLTQILRFTWDLDDGGSLNWQVNAVPIPPALLLFGSALAGVGFLSRKRKKQEPSLL